MTDGLGRTLDYLRLSVTDLCNLRCVYCMPPEGVCKRAHGEICSLEELEALAAAFVALGIQKIRLTGGEPLVRRGILELVARLSALRSAGLRELTMTTNGLLLADCAAALRAAGLDRLNVSLDSLRPARYRALTRGGELEQVLAGLEAAEAAGFRDIRLNAVLLKGVNEDELADLARLAETHPWSVRFIELMPIGPGTAMAQAFLPASRVLEAVPELREMQNARCNMQHDLKPAGGGVLRSEASPFGDAPTVAERKSRDPIGVARLYTAPGWAGTVGLIAPMSDRFCDTCSRLRLTADGKLKLCLHAAEEIPLRGLRGTALTETIEAAVQKKPAGHCLSALIPSDSVRPMNEIGG